MPTSIIDQKISRDELEQWISECLGSCQRGRVADYIPELKKANPNHLAIALHYLDGETVFAGDVEVPFTMQSISKVLSLALAIMDVGEEAVFDKVGMEPTGDPFNSIVKLETIAPNKPLNPMINAGAIAVTSFIKGKTLEERLERLLNLVRSCVGHRHVNYSKEVAHSEAQTADLNRALAYFMREHGVLSGDIDEILELYFRQCAIELNSKELARIGSVFANEGRDLESGEVIIPHRVNQICKTFMVTCGMYNASGEFAIRVGIPAKSGVSGGIMGLVPQLVGIGVLGPALDEKGNSIAGLSLLQKMANTHHWSIF